VECFIQNVNDIDADKLRSLEHFVGQHLLANQQVVIRGVDVGTEKGDETRNQSLKSSYG
jgi:hypothetical protein